MFLYPWSQMVGGIFYEHSHRVIGAVVGLLTLALAASLWGAGSLLRGLGLLAVATVCVQGLLGGLRVVLLKETLAIVHGCLAQAFFALLVVLAVVTSRRWRAPAADLAVAGGTRRLALAAAAALYGQIVLGALTTHAGWVTLHLAGAAVALVLTVALAGRLLAVHGGEPALSRPAALLGTLMVLQLVLGVGAYVVRFTGLAVPAGATLTLALPVTHRMTASLLLGLVVALALWSARGRHAVGRRARIGRELVSPEVAA
jgi:heme a synthase